MTTIEAMQAGRRRAEHERRLNAIRRVQAYEQWLKAGSVMRLVPEIPSDADYRIARAAGTVTR